MTEVIVQHRLHIIIASGAAPFYSSPYLLSLYKREKKYVKKTTTLSGCELQEII